MKEKILPKKGTRFIFFSGKGGVGKSTMSCATAVWLANKSYNTLLVTTDPAPNLSDIFSQEIGSKITKINSVNNLSAIEINPDQASEEYKDRVMSPLKGILDEKTLKVTREQMDSPCVEEVAAFDKFIEFMDDPKFDVVIFDTAPTGHTIRLLQLPQGWSEEIARGGATCIGPSDSLTGAKQKYDKAVSYLKDNDKTTFAFVMKPEDSSFFETKRSYAELEKLGIKSNVIIINGILPEEANTLEFYKKKRDAQESIIDEVKKNFDNSEIIKYPLKETELNGSELLMDVAKTIIENKYVETKILINQGQEDFVFDKDSSIYEKITPKNGTRFIFVTGKGGVGKSTLACSTGVFVSKKGYKTLVVTTDPASHLQNIFGIEINYEPTKVTENLYASRIDRNEALKEYKERIMKHVINGFEANKSIKVDIEATKKKIEEELKSPCSEEMATFEKFMSYFEFECYDVIIIDTAPTGHTLRLLELPTMWKGFIDLGTLTKDTSNETKKKYENIIATMKDTNKSTFVFVMYPEYTPIMEAYRASEELKRQVGIQPGLVAVNYIMPKEHAKNDFFISRLNQQTKYLKEIKKKFNVPLLSITMFENEPKGIENLRNLAKDIF